MESGTNVVFLPTYFLVFLHKNGLYTSISRILQLVWKFWETMDIPKTAHSTSYTMF